MYIFTNGALRVKYSSKIGKVYPHHHRFQCNLALLYNVKKIPGILEKKICCLKNSSNLTKASIIQFQGMPQAKEKKETLEARFEHGFIRLKSSIFPAGQTASHK